jgi:hypothetical protein
MRAIRLSGIELQKYIDNLIAQGESIKKILAEISVYSNGSINLQDLYNMPMTQIKMIEKVISDKIKSENKVTGKEYL